MCFEELVQPRSVLHQPIRCAALVEDRDRCTIQLGILQQANHFAADNPEPRLQDFLKKHRDKYGADPNSITGLAYDAAHVLFESLKKLREQDPAAFAGLSSARAGSEERKAATKKLRDLIATTTNYAGVTGSITLDENRNATKPAVVLEIKGGKKVFNTSINP